MTRFTSPSPEGSSYTSILWKDSRSYPGVRIAVRRPSLVQRIDLNHRVRELACKHEFLKAGDTADQLEALLSEMLVQKLYVEWGLVEVTGLSIDGDPATPASLLEKGPEILVDEAVSAIQAELSLTEEERKNF